MKSLDPNFYENLKAFKNFKDVASAEIYQKFPLDWVVVLTDVRGSTQAIKEGRYRDVNLMGSACITTVLNVCGRRHIPFIFGGDGATVVVPSEQLEIVKTALLSTRKLSREQFKLDLRVGCVPISDIEAAGKSVLVAKDEIAEGNFLAVFSGGGLSLAETWVKNGAPNGKDYLLGDKDESEVPRLEGLSCRWSPMKSSNGKILSLLVMARGEDAEKTYSETIDYFSGLFESFQAVKPVRPEGLVGEPLLVAAKKEAMLSGKTGFGFFKVYLKTLVIVSIAVLFFKYKLKAKGFDPESYKVEFSNNTDFRKFDDTLKMVVDCSAQQMVDILQFLEGLKAKEKVFYGMHTSKEALITCLVFAPSTNQHVHFIDGSDGGYAMAAIQLKAQIKASQTGV